MNFTQGELIQATGGTLHRGVWTTKVGRICTDTRSLQAGETFLALDGKNFTGASFIEAAVEKGAQGVISTAMMPDDYPKDRFYIQVTDSTKALGDIAREWRKVVDPTVIAVSGSAGKTTTKEMLAYICSENFEMLATEGNLNNLIGLPLTLLRLKEQHEIAIVELGMNQPGELTELTNICMPDIGIMTNIGNAHIGNFGSLQNLINGEAEIFEAMSPQATAVINLDCPHASMIADARRVPGMLITYGQQDRADVRATNVRLCKPFGYLFDLHVLDLSREVHLKVFGRYQVSNALAAAAAAAAAGVDPSIIAERLGSFTPPSMRSQAEWFDGILIVTDCYNASPDATITAIRSLNDVSGLQRRIALLGDMLELGDHSERYHRQVGAIAAEAKLDLVVTVGSSAAIITEEATSRGCNAIHFAKGEEAAEYLADYLEQNDGMVVKGSRGVRMEDVLTRLREIRSARFLGEVIPENLRSN